MLLPAEGQRGSGWVQDFNLIVAAGQQLVVRGLPLVPDRLGPGQLSMLELS